MAELHKPPDGYEWIDGGPAIRLIDPTWCPAGHPHEGGQRGWAPCSPHGGHEKWTCGCGQVLYLHGGEFVTQLPCR